VKIQTKESSIIENILSQKKINKTGRKLVYTKYSTNFCEGEKDSDNLQEYTIFDIEFIDIRMQIWCLRYDKNFAHIDFKCNQYKTYIRFVAPTDQKVVS
jgi:hypothetical protein